MGSHPLNLALRFILEIIALIAISVWGYKQGSNITKWLFAIGLPLIFAATWGIFNVPNDPSRSGEAIVITPGYIRLVIEFAIFSIATWSIYDLGYQKFSILLAVVLTGHYLISYDRIIWLLR